MEKLLEIIYTILKNKGVQTPSEISFASDLRKDLGFDSFDLAELTVHIEEHFKKDVFADENIRTFGELCSKLSIK